MVMEWDYTDSIGTYVKIGLSGDPVNRRDQLQTGNPFNLILRETIHVNNMKLAETDAHNVVKDYKSTLGGGTEWFRLPVGANLETFIYKVFNELLDKKRLKG